MLLIREFENKVSEEKLKRNIYGSVHCYNGEEAVAVGVCTALARNDYVISNHRPHGHAIAKGMDIKPIMAEIFGKVSGANKGKGGSMHIQDASVGLIASTGIVGSGIPLACGAGFASKYKGDGRISCIFVGDGAANEGTLHESLNLAARWALPVLFVLEDNELAVTTNTRMTSVVNDYVRLAEVYGIEGCHVDGQDVEAVYKISKASAEICRKESRPAFIQAHTIRFNEHAEGEYYLRMKEKKYRDYYELKIKMKSRCPIKCYEDVLKKKNRITETEIGILQETVLKEVEKAYLYAISSNIPDEDMAFQNIYCGQN